MIAAIRIRGRVKVPKEIRETLNYLKLRHKFVCSLYKEDKALLGMLEKARAWIAYGKINDETLRELLERRARKIGNRELSKEEIEKILKELKKGKKLKEIVEKFKLKPFFRLQPPKGGFKKSIKFLWPQGILGNIGNGINDLIKKML